MNPKMSSPEFLIEKKRLADAQWKRTKCEVFWYRGYLPVGTEYKGFETQDHGYVMLRDGAFGRRFYQI